MIPLTDQERQMLRKFDEVRRQSLTTDPRLPSAGQIMADQLRRGLPVLDDTTIAKVILAFGHILSDIARDSPELRSLMAVVTYAAAVLAGPELADPSDASRG